MENYQKYYKGSTDMEYYRVAASRYTWFRKLQLEHPDKRLVPSRDISAAWAADLLRPSEYDHPQGHGDEWLFHQQHRLLQSG